MGALRRWPPLLGDLQGGLRREEEDEDYAGGAMERVRGGPREGDGEGTRMAMERAHESGKSEKRGMEEGTASHETSRNNQSVWVGLSLISRYNLLISIKKRSEVASDNAAHPTVHTYCSYLTLVGLVSRSVSID